MAGRSQTPPEQTVKTLRAPAGFKVSLWAAEPMVVNPTAIDVDSRGRVWIAEGLNYRFFRNGEFKKAPGCDKIKILEDTDGDGRADKTTDFAVDIYPVPMGLAVEERWENGVYKGCRVYTGNSPDLLVLEDTDGDDKADRRRPLLTGFGGYDHDHGVHGMTLAPDGKLYFTQGNGGLDKRDPKLPAGTTFDVTDAMGRRLSMAEQGTTFRCNTDGSRLEALAWRFRNNYECWVNSFGEVFVSDNDDDGNRGSRMLWLMEGGNYGYQNPRSKRHWAEELPGIVPKLAGTGNGSPCGILVYEGREFPPEYVGNVFQVDAGTRQVNYHPLRRHGGAFRTEYEVFLKGSDPNFRPIDVAIAPDGSMLVADWYDAGVGGHRFTDQTTGRIYRVTPPGSKSKATRAAQPDLATTKGQVAALLSSNNATSFAGRAALLAAGADSRGALQEVWQGGLPYERARSLHVLAALPKTGQADLLAALKDSDPRLREQAVRMLGSDCTYFGVLEPKIAAPPRLSPDSAAAILSLATDPDPGVGRAVLLCLPRIAPDSQAPAAAKATIEALVATWDGEDRFYLEALRVGLSSWRAATDAALQSLAVKAVEDGPTALGVPLPPYFPTATNDAFAHRSQPSNVTAASKLLGLAWVLQDPDRLPLLDNAIKARSFPGIEMAVESVIAAMPDANAGASLVRQFLADESLDRRARIVQLLIERVSGTWASLAANSDFARLLDTALHRPELRVAAVRLIGAARLKDRAQALIAMASNESEPMAVRATALEVAAALRPKLAAKAALATVTQATGKDAEPLLAAAIAAVGSQLTNEAAASLSALLVDAGRSVELRTKALRALGGNADGAGRLVAAFKSGKVGESLRGELQFTLHNHPDAAVRALAERELPLPKAPAGRSLAKLTDLVKAKKGNAKRGSRLFAREQSDACIRCHRVEGVGQWVGPDLSSIGIKYAKPELLFHTLAPSAAVGYNLNAYAVVCNDGRVLTGLVTEEHADRIVLKTALNERIAVPLSQIETRKQQSKSLMPDGLLDRLNDEEIVDLVEYLSTLRRESQTVGEFALAGPAAKAHELVHAPARRSLTAGRDGYVDLSSLAGAGPIAMLKFTIASEAPQKVKLVLAGRPARELLVGGRAVRLEGPLEVGEPARIAEIAVPRGTTAIGVIVECGSGGIVVTSIADRPLRFGK